MKSSKRVVRVAIAALLLVMLAACGGGGGGDDDSGSGSGSNSGPADNGGSQSAVANAGDDRDVVTGTQVTLDGSQSSGGDGDTITYAWRFVSRPSGSKADLTRANSVTPVFTTDVDGKYVVELAVSDAGQGSATDRVTITATRGNTRPTANAGKDQSVKTGVLVRLDGGASDDADGDTLTYRWQLTTPDASQVSLNNPNTPTPSFLPDQPGDYKATLVVSDGTASSSPDSVTVTAAQANSKPVADAGADQQVASGETARLDGRASSDADDDKLSYSWELKSRPEGSGASLANPNSARPSLTTDVAGDYVSELTVSDGQASDTDRVIVSSVPVLSFFRDQRGDASGNPNYAPAMNVVVRTFTISNTPGGNIPNIPLDRFRLKASGKAFTINNLSTTLLDSSNGSKPMLSFDGLSDPTTIEAGDTLDFSTIASAVETNGQYKFTFTFSVPETGVDYRINYVLTID